MAIFELIEGWYNSRRRHSAIDYLSPLDYERTYRKEAFYRSPIPSPERGYSTTNRCYGTLCTHQLDGSE
jgi:hypothetical protein